MSNWQEIADFHYRNECYYRRLVEEIGKMFGDAAYIADDGTRPGGILCAKVPALVRAALNVEPALPQDTQNSST